MFAGSEIDYLQSEEHLHEQKKIDELANELVSQTDLLKQYLRTSSLLGSNVKNAFDVIITGVMEKRKGLTLVS